MKTPATYEEAMTRIAQLEEIGEAMSDVLHKVVNKCAACPVALEANKVLRKLRS